MKEIIRQYGGSMIAAMVGILLILVIVSIPMGSVAASRPALSADIDYQGFENYWRNR